LATIGAIAGAANPRSYKLWYTAYGTNEEKVTDWIVPNDTDTTYGVTDPPALVVANNTLYCIHGGHDGNGEIWWFYMGTDGKLSGDQQLNGLTGSPPALIESNGQLYSVYQRGGGDDKIAWTTVPFNSHSDHPDNPDKNWTEVHGANSYCYYELDNVAIQSQHIVTSKTINVQAGAAALYAGLTKSEDDVDFPNGATLTITAPDGSAFSSARDDDTALVLLSGATLQALVLVNPQAGDYKVALAVPTQTPFHFEFETVPSKDVFTTIVNAISNASSAAGTSLAARDLPVNYPGSLLRFLSKGLLDQLARLWILVAKGGKNPKTGGGRAVTRGARTVLAQTSEVVRQFLPALLLPVLRESLQLAAEQEEQPNSAPVDGDFRIDLFDGDPPRTYTTYRQFILGMRIALLESRDRGDFAIRAVFGGGGSAPWIRINRNNVYLTHFNSQTQGTNAPTLTANTWQQIPDDLINYPSPSADPAEQLTINLGAVTGALANANSWAAAGGRGVTLTHNSVVILAFVIAEATRFDLIAFATEAALNFTLENGNLIWDWFRIVVTNWNTTFDRRVPTSLEDTVRFINELPQTEANSRQYLQRILAALEQLGYEGFGANAPGRQ
jgi:hypothetical protein